MPRPPVTVVLPTRDRPERLPLSLASILRAIDESDELIVVDSASQDRDAVPDAVATAVVEFGAARQVSVVRLDEPGVDRARNAGWRAGRHPLVLFTDDDAVVDTGWADAFARAADEHPEAGFFTGRLLPPPEEGPARRPVAVKDDPEPQVFDRTSVGNLGHGASTAVRRAALEAVGGWDENLGAGSRFRSAPEADLYDRVLALGWSGRYEPAAVAWHPQWRSSRELVRLDHGYGQGNGARLRKLWASDRLRARAATRDAVWSWGLAAIPPAVRAGDRLALACTAARLAGTVRGAVGSLRYGVEDGHLVERRSSSSS